MPEQEFIPASQPHEHDSADIQLAVAALMMEVVKADKRIDRLEVAEVIDSLRDNFKLDGKAVGQLLELAGDVGNYVVLLESLTARIREKWNLQDQLQLLKNLWDIAAADNDIDIRETQVIEQIASLLSVEHSLAEQVRIQAEQALIE